MEVRKVQLITCPQLCFENQIAVLNLNWNTEYQYVFAKNVLFRVQKSDYFKGEGVIIYGPELMSTCEDVLLFKELPILKHLHLELTSAQSKVCSYALLLPKLKNFFTSNMVLCWPGNILGIDGHVFESRIAANQQQPYGMPNKDTEIYVTTKKNSPYRILMEKELLMAKDLILYIEIHGPETSSISASEIRSIFKSHANQILYKGCKFYVQYNGFEISMIISDSNVISQKADVFFRALSIEKICVDKVTGITLRKDEVEFAETVTLEIIDGDSGVYSLKYLGDQFRKILDGKFFTNNNQVYSIYHNRRRIKLRISDITCNDKSKNLASLTQQLLNKYSSKHTKRKTQEFTQFYKLNNNTKFRDSYHNSKDDIIIVKDNEKEYEVLSVNVKLERSKESYYDPMGMYIEKDQIIEIDENTIISLLLSKRVFLLHNVIRLHPLLWITLRDMTFKSDKGPTKSILLDRSEWIELCFLTKDTQFHIESEDPKVIVKKIDKITFRNYLQEEDEKKIETKVEKIEKIEKKDIGEKKENETKENKENEKKEGNIQRHKVEISLQELKQSFKDAGLADVDQYVTEIYKKCLLPMTKHITYDLSRFLKLRQSILLYGPPGTGKTTFARILVQVLGCQKEYIQMINATEVKDMWFGNSEKKIRELFEPARVSFKEHGKNSPLFFLIIDEIDSVLARRDSFSKTQDGLVNQFLGELDGVEQIDNILVIGITNRLELLDPAALRPGRFGCKIEIGRPTKKGRRHIYDLYLNHISKESIFHDTFQNTLDENLDTLSELSEDFTGAEIQEVLIRALNMVIFERINGNSMQIGLEELVKIIQEMKSYHNVTSFFPRSF